LGNNAGVKKIKDFDIRSRGNLYFIVWNPRKSARTDFAAVAETVDRKPDKR
jgi:hypothetical protein